MPSGSNLLMYGILESEKAQTSFKTLLFANKVVGAFNLYLLVGESEKENQELRKKIQRKLKMTFKTEVTKVVGLKEVLEFYEQNASKGRCC